MSKPSSTAVNDETCIHLDIRGKCTDHTAGRADRAAERGVDRFLAGLARRQHGLVGRNQLLSMGVSRSAIDVRIGSGRLHRVHQGVYLVGHSLLSVRGRWMAAVLACGPGAALSHRSAGQLWGLIPGSATPVDVTRPGYFRPRAGINAHHSRRPDDERVVVDGIPVTSVSRTLFDLAVASDRSQLERALNEAEVRGLRDRLSLPDLLARYPGHRGSAVLRSLLRDDTRWRGITRFELEKRFAALIDAHGLPRPRLNADLAIRGRFFEVDCLWPEQRLVVELDGRATHGTKRAFESDRERDRILLAEGWRVARVTWRQLRDDSGTVVADLRRLLTA